MTTQTTIYTADVITAETVLDLYEYRCEGAHVDFTTWTATGAWQGEIETSRVWQHIGTDGDLLVEAIRFALTRTDEQYLYVTRLEVSDELIPVWGEQQR